MAQRFDEHARKLIGTPVAIAECGRTDKLGYPNLSADARGTLVYQSERKQKGWLRWYDATGSPIGTRMPELDTPSSFAISPDQRRVAVVMGDTGDLWMLDLEHPTPNRLTFYDDLTQLGALYAPVWSPDSKRIAYSVQAGHDVVHVHSIETLRDTAVFVGPGLFATVSGWSPDGILALSCADTIEGYDLWRLSVDKTLAASLYQATPEFEYGGPLSPDGRSLACWTAGKARMELRILSWPQAGTRFQVALDEDWVPWIIQWSADGRALILLDQKRRVIAVPVQFEGGFQQGAPRVLLTLPPNTALVGISPDLRRFLLLETEPLPNPAPLRVLTSWRERLKGR
jgi:hypothetical protein